MQLIAGSDVSMRDVHKYTAALAAVSMASIATRTAKIVEFPINGRATIKWMKEIARNVTTAPT